MSGWFSNLLNQVYFKYLTNYYIIVLNETYANQFMNTKTELSAGPTHEHNRNYYTDQLWFSKVECQDGLVFY